MWELVPEVKRDGKLINQMGGDGRGQACRVSHETDLHILIPPYHLKPFKLSQNRAKRFNM